MGRFTSGSALVAAVVMASAPAMAHQITIVNCVDDPGSTTTEFMAYNADDSARTVPYSTRKLEYRDSGHLTCKGDGEHYCVVKSSFGGGHHRVRETATWFSGDEDKTHVVEGVYDCWDTPW